MCKGDDENEEIRAVKKRRFGAFRIRYGEYEKV